MTRRIIVIVQLFFVLYAGLAQNSQPLPRWKFQSINQLGLLNGENKTAFHLQTVNGFRNNNLFMGIGAGLDYYQYRTIPLFAALRKYFGKPGNQFFLYADGGPNFVWEKDNDAYNYTEKNYPGLYGNAGLGYQAAFKNGMGIVLSTGYSYKKVKRSQESFICPFVGPCHMQTDDYTYDFNRLIVQIGWLF